ncbi:hypothetical protein C789_1123 [Microcystis aeruginosa FACHB-905 = DIANCHI905]|uniref:Uncharacterized protein n=1 Tax=Microcystis aeruginosa PCC 7806SL TaxID=1903187 RepID=A0AB33BSQ3_MICA7|nr:hypothetical protein BH695_3608 [Microcystis aeruginosa PCC 7806SL]ELS49116.1 hypothetical protein C789_1123 [Microcystis aeruginosa FACHB-905 = DIANCHI905]
MPMPKSGLMLYLFQNENCCIWYFLIDKKSKSLTQQGF